MNWIVAATQSGPASSVLAILGYSCAAGWSGSLPECVVRRLERLPAKAISGKARLCELVAFFDLATSTTIPGQLDHISLLAMRHSVRSAFYLGGGPTAESEFSAQEVRRFTRRDNELAGPYLV